MLNVDWTSGRVSNPLERIFEYTERPIIEQFSLEDAPVLDRLTAPPCVFCEEGTTEQIAYARLINRARVTGGNLLLESPSRKG